MRSITETIKTEVRARQKQSMTLAAIAAELGLDKGRLSRVMRNERALSLRAAEQALDRLGYDLTKLKRRK